MKSVCVFLGSNPGKDGRYVRAAQAMGRELARRGLEIVYGGTNVGLMAVLADSALANGGRVIGVAPRLLVEKGLVHQGLAELIEVEDLHQRKRKMADLSDAFAAMPGGLGTMEEFFEVLTWGQLGYHQKPCGLLDVNGYYRPLHELLDGMVTEGFLPEEHRRMVLSADTPAGLIAAFENYQPPTCGKWIDRPGA